ncbi:MAG: trypsin-like peptidase domain-containing protein, partial [Bacteroidia bacterium]|nr:trypsin-like peptidase domain-containing protein [Bacteroidia bacterium]
DEDEIKHKIGKAFIKSGFNIVGFGDVFSELDENLRPDYVIAIIIDSLKFNYDFSSFRLNYFRSYLYCQVKIMSVANNKIVMDETIRSQFLSEEESANSAGSFYETNFNTYFKSVFPKLVEDIMATYKFKKLVNANETSSSATEPNEKITIKKQTQKIAGINVKQSLQSCITIETGSKRGSGFIISKNGMVLTCYHNVLGNTLVEVILSNNVRLKANVIRTAPDVDVALLQIENASAVPLPIGNSNEINVGEEAWVIGTPGFAELGQSVSKGIISGNRSFEEKQYIQTDASVSPGNSGGPLLNSKGEVLGIVNAKIIAKGMEGIGFAIPVLKALEVLNVVLVD